MVEENSTYTETPQTSCLQNARRSNMMQRGNMKFKINNNKESCEWISNQSNNCVHAMQSSPVCLFLPFVQVKKIWSLVTIIVGGVITSLLCSWNQTVTSHGYDGSPFKFTTSLISALEAWFHTDKLNYLLRKIQWIGWQILEQFSSQLSLEEK